MSSQRVGPGGMNLLNPFPTQWATGRAEAKDQITLGQQIQQTLFGRPKPPILDPSKFPHLSRQFRLLKKYRKKLATMIGDSEEEYPMLLADDTIAQIDGEGHIYMGAEFLEEEGDHPDVIVGVLAHEIGHRPKRWEVYRQLGNLTKEEIEAICREEEARADAFSGAGLAEMNLSPDGIVDFLRRITDKPHPEYFSVDIRAEIIFEAYKARMFRARMRKKMFPDLDRATSPKNHLGDF